MAIIDRAQDIQNERRKNEIRSLIDGIGASVSNRLAVVLSAIR